MAKVKDWVEILKTAFILHEEGVSGEALAKEQGVTNDAVYHAIRRFRIKGYKVTQKDGIYYCTDDKLKGGVSREPSEDSSIGRLLKTLKDKGEEGISVQEALDSGIYDKYPSVQSGVHDLRDSGYRIDQDRGRYFWKGYGNSYSRNPRSNKMVLVPSQKSSKKKSAPKTTTSTQEKKPDIKRPKDNKVNPYDVFVIRPDRIQEALKVLPGELRKGLMETQHNAEKYNKTIRMFFEAYDKAGQLFSGK